MDNEMCRLCLSKEKLAPLFENSKLTNEYSAILLLTTGLKIEANDGLPQKICARCSSVVNLALDLRNRSQDSERRLLNQKNQENLVTKAEIDQPITSTDDSIIEFDEDCENYKESQDATIENTVKNGTTAKSPSVKKVSKKEKHQMYLDLVEGTLDSNGPVKCKICKNTVSKWSCFLSHAKLHLGFKFMCEFCGKSFITSTQLNRHCRSYHGMQRELKCKHCSYLALDNAQLKLHERRMHTGERPYVCDICASSYHSRRCLVQHIESHRTEATVQCASCPGVFKSRRALARHRYSAHAHARAACPHCARAYSRNYLHVHVARRHAEVGDS